ncbi:Gfo/Idh/MocA family protein [Thermoproteota archaeon]
MLKIGIIGLGVMGKLHYKTLKKRSDVEIEGLCDAVVNEFENTNVFQTVDDLIAASHLDGVIIATPTSTHKEFALKFIEKNIPVFIEKPIALSPEQGYEIVSAARANNTLVCIGYSERFNPVIIALKEALADQTIRSVSITRVGPFPPRVADMGILTDLSVHDIDLLRFLTGREIIERTILCSQNVHPKYEDTAVLTFKMEQDIIGLIKTNWLTPFRSRIVEIACMDGFFIADLMTQDLKKYTSGANSGYEVKEWFVKKGQSLDNEQDAFITYIKTGKLNSLASPEDSIKSLELSQLVLKR